MTPPTGSLREIEQASHLGPSGELAAHLGRGVGGSGRGNVQTAGGSSYYIYDSDNLLTSAWGQATLSYDPLGRLHQVAAGASATRMFYDGATLIAEYDNANALQRRYVHGPGTDEPLVWYEGTGTSDRRWYHADERGSIVAISNGSGAVTNVNSYDEYGIPGSGNTGRFQYTGQQWLSEIGMYHYRARMYSPTLGRFLQTDPIGYGDGMNLYAYVRNDPANFTDPTGLAQQDDMTTEDVCVDDCGGGGTIVVTGERNPRREPPPPPTLHTSSLVFGSTGIGSNESGTSGDSGDDGPGCTAPDPNTGEYPPECTIVATGTPIPEVQLASATQQPLPPGYVPYPESGGRMMYRTDDPRRTPVLTPERQRSACQNYDRLQRSEAQAGLAGVALGTFFKSGPAGLMVWLGNAVIALLAFADRPPGC